VVCQPNHLDEWPDKWMVANALSKRSRAEIFEFVGSNTVNVEDVYFLPIRMSQLLGALAE
jgi:hypothetical protein